MKPLGHDFDPNNPDDVDWLWKWAQLAQRKIREREIYDPAF